MLACARLLLFLNAQDYEILKAKAAEQQAERAKEAKARSYHYTQNPHLPQAAWREEEQKQLQQYFNPEFYPGHAESPFRFPGASGV